MVSPPARPAAAGLLAVPVITGADRYLLGALRFAASRHATPVRMLVLATPGGVRELGPVRPER
jgi:hypothetical protein